MDFAQGLLLVLLPEIIPSGFSGVLRIKPGSIVYKISALLTVIGIFKKDICSLESKMK